MGSTPCDSASRTPPTNRSSIASLRKGSAATRAIDVARHLRHALLSDTAAPRLVAVCHPAEAAVVAPLIARLGPRAGARADATTAPGRFTIEEG